MNFKKMTSVIASILLLLQFQFVKAETNSPNNNSINIDSQVSNESKNDIDVNIDIDLNSFNNSVDAVSYIVIDSSTGEEIIGKNEDKIMYPASLTKIMTSLILLESGKIDDMFLVSKEADAVGEASIYATEGEYLSGRDLLYAMMLQSANDACYVVAEGVAGTVENFYKMMNDKAQELGATSSHFSSPNGLHEEDHVTTARDLAIITKEALKYDLFREVILTKEYTLTRTAEKGMKQITNKNRMLFSNKSEYNEYSIGGKTAYTTPAGNCLMEVAKKDDMEIIVISMKSGKIYPDTNKIINYTFDNFKSTSIVEKGEFTQEYNGVYMNLYTKEGIGLISLRDAEIDISNVRKEFKMLTLPVQVAKDSKVAVINTFIDNKLYKSVDVFASQNYTFTIKASVRFLRNIVLFALSLIALKMAINLYKIRKIKTKGYLKNSKFY